MKNGRRVWDINELITALDACTTVADVKRVIRLSGKEVGSGIHRTAYVVQTTNFPVVVKVAHDTYTFDANLSEIKVSHIYRKSTVLAKILAHDKKGMWIVAEFVPETTKMSKIAEFFGVNIHRDLVRDPTAECSDYRLKAYILSNVAVGVKTPAKITSWIGDYYAILEKEGVHDLHSGNWRMRVTGEPVIVDYGFSRHSRNL